MPADAIPLSQIRRILVTKLRHHGDVLLASPVFSALKAAAPLAQIDGLVYADTADMLSGHPDLDQLHAIDRAWKRLGLTGQAKAEWSLLKTLQSRQYDLIVHLTEHPRGAWLSRLLKPRYAVAPRVNGRGRFWKGSFTHFVSPIMGSGRRHVVEQNLDALRRLGMQPAQDQRALTFVPGADAEAHIAARLQSLGLEPGKFVHLHPPSRWHFKCWTAEGWANIIVRIRAAGWPVLLTAAPGAKEGHLIERIQTALAKRNEPPAASLAGALSLKDLGALTAQARCFAGVDSAPMHIAAAMRTPVVVLFGPSGEGHWGPWGTPRIGHHQVITRSAQFNCRPCGLDGCGGGKVSECLTHITPDEVWAAITPLLSDHQPLAHR
ncbi:MAG: putative lipopolysaccharide heptosyltransferase III [Fluviibacter sp.]